MSNRNYNKVWALGPLVIQVLQDSQHDGIAIDLIPRVQLGINPWMYVVIGFDWLTGGFNVGWARPKYLETRLKDEKLHEEQAAKQGLTVKQYRLRWGW